MYITLHIIWKLHGTITTKMGIIDMKINIIILLDEAFVISGIVKVEVSVISRG